MRNKRGLSLIEVVVVLCLIGLLFALLLPQINNNSRRRLAYSILCSHNLKSLGLAYLMYWDDNDRNSIQIKEILPIPIIIPRIVAKKIPITETRTVFTNPTIKAYPNDMDGS